MEFNMTVSHWRWRVDSLDTGAGCQLGQCKPIIRIISIITPIVKVKSVQVHAYNIVVLNAIAIYDRIFLQLVCY